MKTLRGFNLLFKGLTVTQPIRLLDSSGKNLVGCNSQTVYSIRPKFSEPPYYNRDYNEDNLTIFPFRKLF